MGHVVNPISHRLTATLHHDKIWHVRYSFHYSSVYLRLVLARQLVSKILDLKKMRTLALESSIRTVFFSGQLHVFVFLYTSHFSNLLFSLKEDLMPFHLRNKRKNPKADRERKMKRKWRMKKRIYQYIDRSERILNKYKGKGVVIDTFPNRNVFNKAVAIAGTRKQKVDLNQKQRWGRSESGGRQNMGQYKKWNRSFIKQNRNQNKYWNNQSYDKRKHFNGSSSKKFGRKKRRFFSRRPRRLSYYQFIWFMHLLLRNYFLFYTLRLLRLSIDKDITSFTSLFTQTSFAVVSQEHMTADAWGTFIKYKLKRKIPYGKVMSTVLPLLNRMLRYNLLGYKIACNGRMSRRGRSSSIIKSRGGSPFSSVVSYVSYGLSTVVLKNSICGIKVWLFFKKSPKFINSHKVFFF